MNFISPHSVLAFIVSLAFCLNGISQVETFKNKKDRPFYGGQEWFDKERKNMVEKFRNSEFDSIYHRAYIFNKERGKVYNYRLLMIMEKELLLFIQGEYKQFLKEIEKNERMYFEQRNNRTYIIGFRFQRPPHDFAENSFLDEFNRTLLSYLEFNSHKLTEAIKNADLKNDERNFLLYYLHLNIHYLDMCNGRNKEALYDYTADFIKRFKYSRYSSLVEKYTPYRTDMSNWGIEWSMGLVGGYFLRDGTLSDHSSNFMTAFPMGFALNYNDLFVKFQGSYASFQFEYDGLENWGINTSFFGVNGQINLGYLFHIPNTKLTVSPFIGTNGFYVEGYMSEKSEKEDKETESFSWRSRSRIIGVNFDINFHESEACLKNKRQSRAFHRFQIGYSSFSANIGKSLFESDTIFVQYMFGFQTQREKRRPLL